MGRVSDLIKEYKQAPIDSPAEREAKEALTKIVEGEWWAANCKPFKWPSKGKYKWKPFGFSKDEYVMVGNFIIPKWDYEAQMALLTKGKDKA